MSALFNPFAEPIGRAKWWGLQFLILFLGVIALVFMAYGYSDTGADERTTGENAGLLMILAAVVYANLSTCLARLRDTGRSGWWWLAFNLPTVGTALMIYFCGVEAGQNRNFDPDELENRVSNERQPRLQPQAMSAGAARIAEATAPRKTFAAQDARPAFGRR